MPPLDIQGWMERERQKMRDEPNLLSLFLFPDAHENNYLAHHIHMFVIAAVALAGILIEDSWRKILFTSFLWVPLFFQTQRVSHRY